jgi:hypothetical protein
MSGTRYKPARFIWTAWSQLSEKSLIFKETGYDTDRHWTGEKEIHATEVDFVFWKCIFLNRFLLPPILDEVFVPDLLRYLNKLTAADSEQATRQISAPDDGYYFNEVFASEEARRLVAKLFERFEQIPFTPLKEAQKKNPSLDLLSVFCLGLGEVFIFRSGKCEYFGPVGERAEDFEAHVKLINRRMQRLENTIDGQWTSESDLLR